MGSPTKSLRLVLIAFGAISLGSQAAASAQECRAVGMRRDVPLVTSSETAKAIFLAVENDFFPEADKAQYPEVVAVDEGEWWAVFRHRPPEGNLADGTFTRTVGGGQLSLRIAKCDAAISQVWLTR